MQEARDEGDEVATTQPIETLNNLPSEQDAATSTIEDVSSQGRYEYSCMFV